MTRIGEGDVLRVGVVAPISWRVPPRHYGPWEQFASSLTEGLVGRGHDVTLFASADSVTSARLVGTIPTGYSEDPSLDAKVWEALHITTAMEHAEGLDLLHNSFDFLPLTYGSLVATPMVTTIHGFSSEKIVSVYERFDARNAYVAISDADRHPRLTYAATIHHGIPMDRFELVEDPGDHVAFFGRIHPHKGTAEAIDVAAALGQPLVIAGIVQDHAYHERMVAPRVDGRRVRYVGAVGPAGRRDVLGSATCLLHLISFDEPFGYSVVEAMAHGTPVVAVARGAMPEIVQPGVNGFLVESMDEAVDAARRCRDLDRAAVRRSVLDRFHVDRMVDDYVALYRRVLAAGAGQVR